VSSQVATELIKLIPDVLWILLVVVLITVFYRPIRDNLLPRISGINAFGVGLTFIRENLDRAVETQPVKVSKNDREQTLRRAQRIAPLWRDAQILWVDDNQDGNSYERRVMRSFGASIDLASSTEEALKMLKQKSVSYDAVISDMKRGDNEQEGTHFIQSMREEQVYQWITFYVRNLIESKGTPAYAHGITNRPDHLLHNVMDILERERS